MHRSCIKYNMGFFWIIQNDAGTPTTPRKRVFISRFKLGERLADRVKSRHQVFIRLDYDQGILISLVAMSIPCNKHIIT